MYVSLPVPEHGNEQQTCMDVWMDSFVGYMRFPLAEHPNENKPICMYEGRQRHWDCHLVPFVCRLYIYVCMDACVLGYICIYIYIYILMLLIPTWPSIAKLWPVTIQSYIDTHLLLIAEKGWIWWTIFCHFRAKAKQQLGLGVWLLVGKTKVGCIIMKGMWISLYFGNQKYVQTIGLQSAICAPESLDEHSARNDRKRLVRGRRFLLKTLHFAWFASEEKSFLLWWVEFKTKVYWYCVLLQKHYLPWAQ